jgi:hypothetical protein
LPEKNLARARAPDSGSTCRLASLPRKAFSSAFSLFKAVFAKKALAIFKLMIYQRSILITGSMLLG